MQRLWSHRSIRFIAGPLILLAPLLVLISSTSVFAHAHSFIGPKPNYLAIGDSLAFGYQPDLDFDDGYVNDFSADIHQHGGEHTANLGCPGETSVSMINGGCPYPLLRKYPYLGSQLNAALSYLQHHRGQVSPVTLDIGANDINTDIDAKTCALDVDNFQQDLTILDNNLQRIILPKLRDALTVNGVVTGDLILMNYYDPYLKSCPNTLPYIQILNQHLAKDISGYGTIVDVYKAFGGASAPICSYTWMCTFFHDIHATKQGYAVIAKAFEETVGY